MNISRFFQYTVNALVIKFGLAVIQIKVNPDSSFVQTSDRAHIPNAIYQVPRPLTFWFKSRRYLNGFILYGHGRHLGDVTINIWFKFTPLNLRSLHMKFEFNWPCGF